MSTNFGSNSFIPLTKEAIHRKALYFYTPPFTYLEGFIHDADFQVIANASVVLGLKGSKKLHELEGSEMVIRQIGNMVAFGLTEYWERELLKLSDFH